MMKRKLERLCHEVAEKLGHAGRVVSRNKQTGQVVDATEYMAGVCDMAQVVVLYRDLDFKDAIDLIAALMAKHAEDMEERAQNMKLLEAADE
ncbi:MAG: hypothetical protein SO057_06185 [Atopobiaceae bacterium]|nr:hypothetical protein [Atopobiaceae bacterium]